jgi:hypothetical protein
MNINVIVLGLLLTVLGLYSWKAYSQPIESVPTFLPWVPIQVGKQRSFVNQTRDAGMSIERTRRTAIISNQSSTFSYKGSTNGYLEYGLSGICICPPKPICPVAPNVVWSDGDADDVICDNVDAGGAFGGYDVIDFGGAAGNDCDV